MVSLACKRFLTMFPVPDRGGGQLRIDQFRCNGTGTWLV